MFSTKNCWPRLSESRCATRRAMTSVGPPAGNPTTTFTERFGYPCANNGVAPDSNNVTTRNARKTGAMALSLENVFVAAIIGESAAQNKSKAAHQQGKRAGR